MTETILTWLNTILGVALAAYIFFSRNFTSKSKNSPNGDIKIDYARHDERIKALEKELQAMRDWKHDKVVPLLTYVKHLENQGIGFGNKGDKP